MPDRTKMTKHAKAHDQMLKEALAHPGVYDLMKVYRNWQEKDQQIEPYRFCIQESTKTKTTNSSSTKA